jgi:ribosome-associated toxin RatA of RatAB toxin-antitoxin module
MREVSVTALIDADANRAYRLLSDFAEYPRYMSSVRTVTVHEQTDQGCISAWEIDFREGVLKWTERDRFDAAQRCIAFEQIDGDMEIFKGAWRVIAVGAEQARVEFTSVFDMGIPSLAAFLEPVAQDALIDNISKVIAGLFGKSAVIKAERAARKLAKAG